MLCVNNMTTYMTLYNKSKEICEWEHDAGICQDS